MKEKERSACTGATRPFLLYLSQSLNWLEYATQGGTWIARKQINKYINLIMLRGASPGWLIHAICPYSATVSFYSGGELFPCRTNLVQGQDSTVNHLAFKICPESGFSLSSKCRAVLQSRLPPSTDVTFDLLLWLLLKGGKHAIPCCGTQAADEVFYNACKFVRSL